MTTYGDRLAQAMAASGHRRKSLAAGIGRSVQAVGDVLLGKTKALTSENNARAARFLGVSPDQRRYPRKLADEHCAIIGEIVHKQSERI